jgi:hypothetical protein
MKKLKQRARLAAATVYFLLAIHERIEAEQNK